MATKDPLIGRTVRVLPDATTLKGQPHPKAGQQGTVQGRTPGGKQYQVLVGEDIVNLPMDAFEVHGTTAEPTEGNTLPLDALAPSRTNRPVANDEALQELAATIKLHGILQPILVRKLPPERLQDTFESADTRHATHEIIAGERRWRAARIAGLRTIPVLIKDADAPRALTMQLVENLHRADISPLDEAMGILRLIEEHGYTREQAADEIRKSRTHVYEALRLPGLCAEALVAMRQGILKRSVALLVAQRPTPALQQEFTRKVLTGGPDNGPLSYRAALDLARRNYMTDLAQAPFALDDAALLPKAGACTQCPKRTGAAPELWDKQGADVCTDTTCFADKKDAHYTRITIQAKERGRTVITGAEAREIMPNEGVAPTGYILLDKPRKGDTQPLRTLLGDEVPEGKIVLIETPSGAMVEAVPTRAAGAVLEARGKAAKPQAAPKTGEPTREELEAEYQQRWRGAAVLATIEGLNLTALSTSEPQALDVLPTQVAYRTMLELAREVPDKFLHAIFPALLRGFGDEDLAQAVRAAAEQDTRLRHMHMMMLVSAVDHEPLFDRPADEALHLEAVAPIATVDLPAIRAQIQAQMREEAHYRDNPAAAQPDTAKPAIKPKGKGKAGAENKTTAAEAQAAIAQAMAAADGINAFAPGQAVRVRIDLKNAKGHLLPTKGTQAVITSKTGDRAWMLDIEDMPTGKGLIADYTELEAIDEAE